MASEKTAGDILTDIDCILHDDGTIPMRCYWCCVKAMESYAAQEVEKQKRKDVGMARKAEVYAAVLGTDNDIREQIAQVIEKGEAK